MTTRRLEIKDAKSLEMVFLDDKMEFDEKRITDFIKQKDNYGFIIEDNKQVIGFAYGYLLNRPDSRGPMFYVHSITIHSSYRNKKYGTSLMNYIDKFAHYIGCSKCFIITDKSNIAACKLYQNTGFNNDYEDEIVYVKHY